MAQLKFSVPRNTEAYLRWYSRIYLADGSPNLAARHLFERGLAAWRLDHADESFADYVDEPVPDEAGDKA